VSGQRTVVLVDEPSPGGRDGGVQHEVVLLETACKSLGVPVVRVRTDLVTETLRLLSRAPAVVFTQQEGALSTGYARQAGEWLSCGATVVEKNVFALPSPWRPRHPRYLMALMSLDGSHRLRLRSLLGGASRPGSWIHLPNPYEHGPATESPRDADVDLHVLRVGRPDIRKWSPFEVNFVRRAATAHPDMAFRLTLVGLPDEMAPVVLPPNVDVVALPYLRRSRLNELYARAHVYLHHSRIGETYGNTLAEATMHGMRIVLGSEPGWDCAPIEFIPADSVVGTPRHLCRAAPQLVRRFLGTPQKQAQGFRDGQTFVTRLLALAEEPARDGLPEPRLRDSLRYLMNLGEQISGVTRTDCAKAVAKEVLSGYRRIRRVR
jgi:hypothetical protein